MFKLTDNRLFWFIARRLPHSWTYQHAVRCSFRECGKDPAFRAELANWAPVNSPAGQQAISQITD